ncbi:MAG: hypothetical protein QG635_1879, partial [Bacteroidota bacterium]|nr:hypothetical protein [Bacteroidota bacterium]
LLYKYTGQTDLLIGVPAANRNRREYQQIMGLFLNTLPIRTNIEQSESFAGLLKRVSETVKEALTHQELPFERLIEELNPKRDLSRHPLFQVIFVHQNFPGLYKVSGMTLKPFKVDYGSSKYDLDLWAEEVEGELLLTLTYNSDIFSISTAERFLKRYRVLLESILENPYSNIAQLNIISEDEKNFLQELTKIDTDNNVELCIHEQFEKIAGGNPLNFAVTYKNKKITYSELDKFSNLLANKLIDSSVQPDEPICLLTSRSEKAIIGILGIMKSGAAFMPADPETMPKERIKYILDDSAAKVIITESKYKDFTDNFQGEIIFLDDDEFYYGNNSGNPKINYDISKLAYIIYTSGTSGNPKGVCIEHRQLANYTSAILKILRPMAGDIFANVSSLAYDLGYTMLFPALVSGGCIDIIDSELITDASGISEYFRNNPSDFLKITPSHFGSLLTSQEASAIIPRKALLLGGEKLSYSLIERIWELKPDCRIINHYGPTETTIGVLTYEIHKEFQKAGKIPIGKPLGGSSAFILDENNNLAPIGISGEIHIGGENLASGYLNMKDLTDDKFIPNPFGDGRLYRTGDLGRLLESGDIEFLGRIDRQVKIRG